MSIMQLRFLAILTGLCLWSSLALAAPMMNGTISTLDHVNSRISIDAIDLVFSHNIVVRKMGGWTGSLRDLMPKQKVRYSLDVNGLVAEIWVYPSDLNELRDLGYDTEMWDE